MRFVFTALFLVLSTGCSSTHTEPQHVFAVEHPEASPFDETADAKADVERALKKGAVENKITLVAMGANWCHDSRALAGWFETCLLYTSPSPRDQRGSRMPSSA